MNALTLQRLSHRLHRAGVPVVPGLLRRTVQVVFACVLPPELEVGEGTQLGYGGLGVVIHGAARIGRRCLVAQHVTIGGKGGAEGVPVLGDGVLVGAGAKILGPVTIGDGAVIAANAVVLRDVPAGAAVGGIPARPIPISPAAREAFLREMRQHFGVDPAAPDRGAAPRAARGAGG